MGRVSKGVSRLFALTRNTNWWRQLINRPIEAKDDIFCKRDTGYVVFSHFITYDSSIASTIFNLKIAHQ
jgi:hypothetical protein